MLMMCWLFDVLVVFCGMWLVFEVQIVSVWMDVDIVDFFSEFYDCVILFGVGRFGESMYCVKLFDEWLILVCLWVIVMVVCVNFVVCELIYLLFDWCDWCCWFNGSGYDLDLDIMCGQVFDMFEQGIVVVIVGYGLLIGDFVLCVMVIDEKQFVLLFKMVVSIGDVYYFVWLEDFVKVVQVCELYVFLVGWMLCFVYLGVCFVGLG